jgi:F-type H+-transporting ATPase subunit b
MLIDWFTVGAQLLNFAVLVWLMKRFLYQPVLDAIAAREEKIATELADAAATKAEAHRQQDEFSAKIQAFNEQRATLLSQAKDAAKVAGEQLQLEAREAADAARAQRDKALRSDAQQLQAELRRLTQQQVFEISRRVLGDLAGVALEQRACEVFIERLQALEGDALATLGTACKAVTAAEPALLRSAFELPAPQQAAIAAALQAAVRQAVPLKFEVVPEQVSGIELSAAGQQLAWSIADYLAALSLGLDEQQDAEAAA